MLAAARYGHAETVRMLVDEFGCDKNASKSVSLLFIGTGVFVVHMYCMYAYRTYVYLDVCVCVCEHVSTCR